MNVYVFGNEDVEGDNISFKVVGKLKAKFPRVDFIIVKPNQDLPFVNEKKVIIIDQITGIEEETVLKDKDLDKLVLQSSTTAHDYDLGFQLKYLKKLGKIGEITIIGLPMNNKVNYLRIQSILRKLVEQDMHGS